MQYKDPFSGETIIEKGHKGNLLNVLAENSLDTTPSKTCRICGRNLSDAESIKRGIGPECFTKVKKAAMEKLQMSLFNSQK